MKSSLKSPVLLLSIFGLSLGIVFAGNPLQPVESAVAANSDDVVSVSPTTLQLPSYPLGNGKSFQSYKYSQSPAVYNLRIPDAVYQTSVRVQKWNGKSYSTVKTISKPKTVAKGYNIYGVTFPKPGEGRNGKYRVYVPKTDSHSSYLSKAVSITSTPRAKVNLSTKWNILGGKAKTISTTPAYQKPYVNWNNLSASSGKFVVQEHRKGKWVTVATPKKVKQKSGLWNMRVYLPKRNAGSTVKFRLYHPATSKMKSWAGMTTTVKYKFVKTSVYHDTTWYGARSVYPVNTGAKLAYFQVKNGKGQRAYLQKYNAKKKKWYSIKSKKLNNQTWASGNIYLPKVKTQSTVKYRIYLPKTSTQTAAVSKSKTIRYEDARKYKGYRKTVYNYQKRYCPNVIIKSVKPNGSWDGQAWFGSHTFAVVTGLRGERLKFVALHECAHLIQGNTYGQKTDTMEKAADKVYGRGKGVEQMATCMAYKMGGNLKYGSYTKNCSGKRGSAAKKVLSGKRL